MSRPRQIIIRVVGIAAVAVGALGVYLILHADSHVAGSVIARPLGWLPPLVTLLVVSGVGWILFSQLGSGRQSSNWRAATRCPACEREVLGKWRMCPYCGAMLEQPSRGVGAGASQTEQ